MKKDVVKIVCDVDLDEEKKKILQWIARLRFQELNAMTVIYNPDCGCSVDQFVLLDRYPMSKKIISTCPVCQKGCLMEITNPPVFHIELNDQDYQLDDLCEMNISQSNQSPYILLYQQEAKRLRETNKKPTKKKNG